MPNRRYIRFFEEISADDVASVGGKTASLGEMYRKLSPQGVRIPNGFAITAEAYREVLDRAAAWQPLHAALDGLHADDMEDLARRGRRAREIVYGAPLPDELRSEILDAYRALRAEYGQEVAVAVRSSATAEDLPTASFAGQQETFLNVQGQASLALAVRRCFASLFTDRAIHYRATRGIGAAGIALSVGVQR
ncbi:MAG TPA: PEP/pyruvate-binding domain-containing protein, partial [Steroidobacteraceae bacterium]|nr:PEP/pyruvate-binding domain-containing protein [Steroidobacteraceae bacterium]